MTLPATDTSRPPILLEDFLGKGDFARDLAALAGPLHAELHLPERVDEVGLVCPNMLEAATDLNKRYPEMRTFFLGEGSPTEFSEDGCPTPFTTRVGFSFYRGVILELAEPGLGSDIFGQSLDPAGRVTINHLGFKARGDALARKDRGVRREYATIMADAGFERRVEAVLRLYGVLGHIHIFETRPRASGLEIEFLDFRFLSKRGLKVSLPGWLFGLLGWFQVKIGRRIRRMPANHALPPPPSAPLLPPPSR